MISKEITISSNWISDLPEEIHISIIIKPKVEKQVHFFYDSEKIFNTFMNYKFFAIVIGIVFFMLFLP